jgi:ubiquinone/menaquinone biosynthesis C-methylase UbiE
MMILIWDQNKEKLPTIQKMIKNLYSYTIETEILQRLLEFLSKDTNNYERTFKELKLDNLLENIKTKIGDRKLKALTISVNYLQNVTLKTTQTKINDRELNAELHTIVEAPGL